MAGGRSFAHRRPDRGPHDTLSAGRPTVVAPAWNPEQAARDIVAHRVTHINGTDEAAAQLLEVAGAAFSNIRLELAKASIERNRPFTRIYSVHLQF